MSRAASAPAPSTSGYHPRSHTLRNVLLGVALVVLAIVVLARWVLAPLATQLINRKLASAGEYYGRVETVKIALWRGGLEANEFAFYQRGQEQNGPIVRVKEADMRLSWGALFRGKLGGSLIVDNPEVSLIKTEPTPPELKKKPGEMLREVQAKVAPWQDALRRAMPMELSRLEVKNGRVRFLDQTVQPQGEVKLDSLNLVMTGLGNRSDGQELPAKMDLHGVVANSGRLQVNVQANPMAEAPRFATTMRIEGLSLPELNSLLRGLAGVDISQGTFEFYLEANAQDGRYEGYVKPFLKDLDFKTAKDDQKSVGQKVKEAAADVVTSVFKNDSQDKVATKAPFSGSFADNNVDVWTAVDTLLRNAFVQALREGFEGRGGGGRGGGGNDQ